MKKLAVAKFDNESEGVTLVDGVIRIKNGSERASIHLISPSSKVFDTKTRTWWNTAGRHCWESYPISILKSLGVLSQDENGKYSTTLKEGDDFNAILVKRGMGEHDIIMVESTTPFYPGQQPKRRGKNGDIITTDDGEPIYQETQCVPVSAGLTDERIDRSNSQVDITNNVEEEAYKA